MFEQSRSFWPLGKQAALDEILRKQEFRTANNIADRTLTISTIPEDPKQIHIAGLAAHRALKQLNAKPQSYELGRIGSGINAQREAPKNCKELHSFDAFWAGYGFSHRQTPNYSIIQAHDYGERIFYVRIGSENILKRLKP